MSTMESNLFTATRRSVLKGAAALTVAFWLPPAKRAFADAAGTSNELVPNAFLRIGADDTITVTSKHLEMGQGVYTGLATIVAEELDADWRQVRVEGAPADASKYNNTAWGPIQGTGGSTSIANSFEQLTKAGATARALLVAAAAQRWKVPAQEITIESGIVQHAASGKRARFGELVADAAKLPVPVDAKPKDPSQYRLIGQPRPRVDSREKSTGTALYTQDVRLPGMLAAVVLHPPRFGAKVKSFDAAKAKQMRGVHSVVAFETPVRSGVAVLATDFWSAKKARDALVVEWDETNAFRGSSDELLAQYRELAQKPGDSARNDGNVAEALGKAARVLEATYEVPYLSHASMEPLNCVVRIGKDECEVWNGEQFQTADQMAVAKLLGIPQTSVKIHQLYAGGSFGRRANPLSDYVLEAAAIAKAAGVTVPVKLVWTREDDLRAGFFRPMFVHTLKAGLDAQGQLIAWQHRIVGQSILAGTLFGGPGPIDPVSVEGAANLPYAIPNLSVELHSPKIPVPVQWWRSVGSTHTAFATECFLDEIARATGKDPYLFRRELLANHPRHLAVLDLAVEKSGWKNKLAPDEALGLAVHESFGSVVAEVAHLRKRSDGIKLERVTCAVDCGLAINPNIVAMQMEGGIGYGLSATLDGLVTLKDGRVEQGNFDDYPVLRMSQMPPVDVHIVPRREKPSGVGEPSTPVIAPALCNGLAVLTGQPIRSLPLSAQGIRLV